MLSKEISDALISIYRLIGLRNIPEPIDQAEIIRFIQSRYSNHQPNEFVEAFHLALDGTLDVETNCYGVFSAMYFASIMNAYRRWLKKSNPVETKHEIYMPISGEAADVSDRAMEEWLHDLHQQVYAAPNYSVHFISTMLYDWLVKKNIIKKMEDDVALEAASLRRQILFRNSEENPTAQNKSLYDNFLRMQEAGFFEGSEVETMMILAKKIQLLRWLRNRPLGGTLNGKETGGWVDQAPSIAKFGASGPQD